MERWDLLLKDEGLQPEGTPNKPFLTPLMADVFQLSCFSLVSLKTFSVVLSTVSIWCPPLLWGRGSGRGSLSIHGRQWLEERGAEVTRSWRLAFQARGEIAVWS